jgi:hypothetical protein
MIILNKTPTRCTLVLKSLKTLFYLYSARHVSDTTVSIIRSFLLLHMQSLVTVWCWVGCFLQPCSVITNVHLVGILFKYCHCWYTEQWTWNFSDLVRKFCARVWKRHFPPGRLRCASQHCRRGFKLRTPWAPELPRAVTYIWAATSPIIAILWGWCEDDRCEFNHCSQPGHLTQVQWGYGAKWAWSVPLAPSVDVISQHISCKFWSLSLPSLCAMLEAICDPV